MASKGRAGPFPDTAELTLSREATAVGRHGNRVPMLQADIGTIEVRKKLRSNLRGLKRLLLWWCFLDSIIRQVAKVGTSASEITEIN